MEKSARVRSLLQAERTAFAAVAAVERQVSTQLPRPPAGPGVCEDTDTIQGLEEKISYDEENLANWRRSRTPEIRRFADCHEKEETDCVRTRLSLLTKFELDVARHNDQVKLISGRLGLSGAQAAAETCRDCSKRRSGIWRDLLLRPGVALGRKVLS